MGTNSLPSGPEASSRSVDRAWLQGAFETLKQNRPLAPVQRAHQLREMVKGRSLDELQGLAERIVEEQLSLSRIEERELAVRVRELLSPKELSELVETKDINRRLQFLSGRTELLNLVSHHLQPGPWSTFTSGLEKAYQRIINTPNAVGDFFRRQGNLLAERAPNWHVGVTNQVKKGLFLALEFPSLLGKRIPVPSFLSKFADTFRERRTRIEAEERIYMVVNHARTQGNPKIPFIEFRGFDLAAFERLKEKHLPKDADGNVTSERCTEQVRAAILRDVVQATQKFIENKRNPEKGGDASLGTKAEKVLTITMEDLLRPDMPVEQYRERMQNQLVERIKYGVPAEQDPDGQERIPARPSAWGNGVVQSVEFGTTYSFSRADGTLTLPREGVDAYGAPTTDEGRLLQAALAVLPATVRKVTVVAAGENLVLGDEVQLPLNRPETPAQLASFINTVQANPRVSILRSTQNQTMLGSFRYIGEGGRGVLEWNDNLAQVADVQGFLATADILDDARPMDEWRRVADGGWEKVPRT